MSENSTGNIQQSDIKIDVKDFDKINNDNNKSLEEIIEAIKQVEKDIKERKYQISKSEQDLDKKKEEIEKLKQDLAEKETKQTKNINIDDNKSQNKEKVSEEEYNLANLNIRITTSQNELKILTNRLNTLKQLKQKKLFTEIPQRLKSDKYPAYGAAYEEYKKNEVKEIMNIVKAEIITPLTSNKNEKLDKDFIGLVDNINNGQYHDGQLLTLADKIENMPKEYKEIIQSYNINNLDNSFIQPGQQAEQPAADETKKRVDVYEKVKAQKFLDDTTINKTRTKETFSNKLADDTNFHKSQQQIYINEIINRLEKNIWNDKLNVGLAKLKKNEKKEILISVIGNWYREHLKNPKDFYKSKVINPGNEKGVGRVEELSMKDIIEFIVKEKFNFFEKAFEKQPENNQTILMQILMQAAKDPKYYTKYYDESNNVVELLTPIQSGLKDKYGNTALSIALQEENSNDLNIAILFNSKEEREATPKVENLKNIDAKIKERLKKVVNNENITYKFKIQDQQVEDFIKEISSSKSPAETLQQQTNTTKTNDQKENQETNQPLEYTTEEKKEAEVIFDDEIENAYIEELVNRLKNGQWGKVKLSINGEKININKEISELPKKTQKYLLTKALKKIYNSNSEDKNELQYQLNLGNNFNIDNDIINRLIEETVNKNFEREYKEELFAEKRPFLLKRNRTVDLEEINRDIKNIFQQKELTEFEDKVQEQFESFQDTFKQKGEKGCRKLYKDNLGNPVKHEADVVAINRLAKGSKKQKQIYKKIAPTGLIHGIYGKIKNDQKDYNNRWESLDKSLKDCWYFLGIGSEKTKINLKPKKIKFDKANKLMQKYSHDQLAIKVIKFGCDQQNRNITCSKEKDKFPGNMLNTILPAAKNVVIEDAKVLNKAFKEIDNNNSYSITKPMKDDMVYFKILYAHSSEKTKIELLDSPEFKNKFKELSQEKKERFLYFLEDIGEKEKIDKFDFLKSQQKKETHKKPALPDSVILEAIKKGEKLVVEVDGNDHSEENNNHLEEELVPHYLFNQDGVSIKNDENLLAKETFKLQDSFLGLACAKDKKAGVLSNWMRSKKVMVEVKDKNDHKIKKRYEEITSDQVKTQREAEKAARAAIKLAGGDLDNVKKKTMPLLKEKKIKFTFKGTPIPLSQAVRVCLKLEQRRREQELNTGILEGKISEKTTIERICEMLTLTENYSNNDKKTKFSDEEMQEIKKAISMQIIATQAFTETFKGNNKALANKRENGNEQTIQNQREGKNKQSTVNMSNENTPANTLNENTQVNGTIDEFENGLLSKTPEQSQQNSTPTPQEVLTKTSAEPSAEQPQPKINANFNVKQIFDKQKQQEEQTEDKNQQKDASLTGPEKDSRSSTPTSESSTESEKKSIDFEKNPELQPNIQQGNRQSPKNRNLQGFGKVSLTQKEPSGGSKYSRIPTSLTAQQNTQDSGSKTLF